MVNRLDREVIGLGMVLFALLGLFCLALFFSYGRVKAIEVHYLPEINQDVWWNIDQVKYDSAKKTFDIKGWAAYPGQDIKTFETKILLKAENSAQFLQLDTAARVREDVTSHINEKAQDTFNYNYSGFISRVKKGVLEKNRYDVFIYYLNDGHKVLIDTHQVIVV